MDPVLTLGAAVRASHYASAVLLFGSFVFALAVARPARAAVQGTAGEFAALDRVLLRLACIGLGVVIASALLWLWLLAASMSGRTLGAALDPAILALVLSATRFGTVWLVRMAAAAALAALLGWSWRRGGRIDGGRSGLLAAALAVVILAGIAWAGHAADESGLDRAIHLGADMLHLLAAGAWLGALPALVFVLRRARHREAHGWQRIARAATPRFSNIGVASVTALLLSGLVNAWYLVGSIPALVGTPYGQILLGKLALLTALIVLAAINRQSLTPRFVARETPRHARERALTALARNALIEIVLGLAVLTLVGALVASTPAAHEQVEWPFAYRPGVSGQALTAHGETILALAAFLGLAGAGAIAAGVLSRLWWRTATGLILAAAALALALPYFVVTAYPTSFYRSPIAYAAASIARGETVYEKNCALCHGPYGYGGGPAGAALPVRPADLTSEHLYHDLGTLFWWIGHGIAGSLMPGFADKLDADARWDAINFLRAQADAEEASGMTASVEPFRPIAAPDFAFQYPGREQETLKGERGKAIVLLVLYSMPEDGGRLEALAAARPAFERDGVRIIALPMTAAVPPTASAAAEAGILADANAAAVAAYGLFRRVASAEAVLPMPRHMEFLIDRAGYLRARWIPGDVPGWQSLARVQQEIAALAREPPRAPAPEGHVH